MNYYNKMFRTFVIEDDARIREIDISVKNKFAWSWMEQEVAITVNINMTLGFLECPNLCVRWTFLEKLFAFLAIR